MDCSDKKGFWVVSHSSVIWAFGLLLTASLLGLLIWKYPRLGPARSVAEFLGLAGALTVTVDPFLKRRLQRDAAEDIFHHLLGLDLPSEIRESLRDFLLRNNYYRREVDIRIDVQTIPHKPEVQVTVALSAVVVCVKKMKYCQHAAFEEAENAGISEASVTSTSQPTKSYHKSSPVLKENAEQAMVWEWTGNPVDLTKGEQLTTFLKFTLRKPVHDFYTFVFGSSVIHPHVRIYGSNDLYVTVSKADQVNGNEHIHKKVFVEGDHFQVRWKPRPSKPSSVSHEGV